MERDHDHGWRPGDDAPAEADRDVSWPGIELKANGIPVIAGTTAEAHRIAALLDGDMALGEVLQDFAFLTPDQVLAAQAYADRHPPTGHPFPGFTAKKAMRDLNADVLREHMRRRSR